MKKFLLLALVFSVMVTTTPALADDGFYVVAVGGGVGTKITSVPYEIKTPGFYFLGGNLDYNGTRRAITISGLTDVTLDLMGFRLTNTGAKGSTVGIFMENCTNVEIRNGTVRGFYEGIVDSNATAKKHRVINIRVTNNNNGISLVGSNHLIKIVRPQIIPVLAYGVRAA